jgi:hypothetical protein
MSEDGFARDDGDGGPVDRYLDDLFDALAGTGGAGRRALAEAEDHLRAATADRMADGVPIEEAERDAAARFGVPARIASQLRRAHGRPRSAQVISAGWLLAGWTLGGLGATYLIKAVDIAVLLRMHPETEPQCPDNLDQIMRDRLAAAPPDSVVEFGPCSTSASALQANLRVGVLLALLGAAVLLARWLTRRTGRLAPTPRRLTLLAAVGFGAAGLTLLVAPATALGDQFVGRPEPLFGVEPGPGIHHVTLAAGVALLISIAALVRHRFDRRRAQHRRHT